jgi:hypothetical protein
MKEVQIIPEPEVTRVRDPWFDALFDGKLYCLAEADWKARYRTPRSAASAIGQAAQKREIDATVAIRGTEIYVQAKNVKAPRKARKATTAKAPAKRAAKAAG